MPRNKPPNKARRRYLRTSDARARLQQRQGIIEAFRTFAPVYDLLRDLRSGEANAVQGRVVLTDWEQELCEAATALDGWAGCWQRIIDGEGLDIDLAPLRQLHRYLDAGILITTQLIDKVSALTDACYRAYQAIPRQRMREYSQTEMIAIELDALGLRAMTNIKRCETHDKREQ